jgi:hypothetical protein
VSALSEEQFKGHLSFNRWNGKAFRIAQTPLNHPTGGNDPERWSIVTPENPEAKNWPSAPKQLQIKAKQRWNKIQKDPGAQYKIDQIRRSIVKEAHGQKVTLIKGLKKQAILNLNLRVLS